MVKGKGKQKGKGKSVNETEPIEKQSISQLLQLNYNKIRAQWENKEFAVGKTEWYNTILHEYKRHILPILGHSQFDKNVEEECVKFKHTSQLQFVMTVVYFSSILSLESHPIWFSEYCKNERIRALVNNHTLEPKDIECISSFRSMVAMPQKACSHQQSLQLCLAHVQKCLRGSQDSISEASLTYESLKQTVSTIMESTFVKVNPPPCKFHVEVEEPRNFFKWTLKEWLEGNKSSIVKTIEVCHEGKVYLTENRLTEEVRSIIRGILRILKANHDSLYICGQLDIENVLVSQYFDVKLQDVNLKHCSKLSEFKNDLEKVGLIIGRMVDCTNKSWPKDANHFRTMIGLAKLSEHRRTSLYYHPSFWSGIEVIKNVNLFRMIYFSSHKDVRTEIADTYIRMPTDSFCRRSEFNQIHRYRDYRKKWKSRKFSVLLNPIAEIFTFMRDAYPHMGNSNLLEMESELFALFPLYLSCFVDAAARIESITDIIYEPKAI